MIGCIDNNYLHMSWSNRSRAGDQQGDTTSSDIIQTPIGLKHLEARHDHRLQHLQSLSQLIRPVTKRTRSHGLPPPPTLRTPRSDFESTKASSHSIPYSLHKESIYEPEQLQRLAEEDVSVKDCQKLQQRRKPPQSTDQNPAAETQEETVGADPPIMTQSSNKTSARGLDSCDPSQTARRAPPQVLDMVDQSSNFVRNQNSANKQRRREEKIYYLDVFHQSTESSASAMWPSQTGTTQQPSAPAARAMDPSWPPVDPGNSARPRHVNGDTPMYRHAATPYTAPVSQPVPTNLTPQQHQQYRQRQQWLSQQVPVQQQMLEQLRACQQAMMYPRQPNPQVNPQMLVHTQSQARMTPQRQVPGRQQHANFQQAMHRQQQQPMLANRSPQMSPTLAQYPATGFRGGVTGDPGPSTQRVVRPQTPGQEARARSRVDPQSRLQGMQQQQRRLEILRMQHTSQNNQHNPVPIVRSPVPQAPTPELQAQARHRPSAQQKHYRNMQEQGQFQTHIMQDRARQYLPSPFLNQPQPIRPQATQMLENQAQAFSRITELSPSPVPQDQALRMANRATSTAPQLRGQVRPSSQLGNHNGNLTVAKTMPPGEGFDRDRSTTVSNTGRKRTFQQTSEDRRNLSSSPPVSKDQQQQKKRKIDKGKTSVREAPTPLPTGEEHIRLSGTSTAATGSPPPPCTSSTEPATEFDELFETTVAAQSQDSAEGLSVIDLPAAPASTSTDVTSIGHTLSSDEYVKFANSPCTSPENWSTSTGVDAGHQKSPDLEASAVLTKEELEEFGPLIAFLGRVEDRGEMSMFLDEECCTSIVKVDVRLC